MKLNRHIPLTTNTNKTVGGDDQARLLTVKDGVNDAELEGAIRNNGLDEIVLRVDGEKRMVLQSRDLGMNPFVESPQTGETLSVGAIDGEILLVDDEIAMQGALSFGVALGGAVALKSAIEGGILLLTGSAAGPAGLLVAGGVALAGASSAGLALNGARLDASEDALAELADATVAFRPELPKHRKAQAQEAAETAAE